VSNASTSCIGLTYYCDIFQCSWSFVRLALQVLHRSLIHTGFDCWRFGSRLMAWFVKSECICFPLKNRKNTVVFERRLLSSLLLHFAWVVDDMKCIVVTCVWQSVCLCVSVRSRTPTLLHGPGCNLGVVAYPLLVHCWADLQSVHGLRCYGNIREP